MKTNRTNRTIAGLSLRGLRACEVKPGHGYYLGASTSPSFVIVLSVSDTVRYANAYTLAVSTSPLSIFADLACTALDTIAQDAARTELSIGTPGAMGRLAQQIAEMCAARVAAHGAPVDVADYDRMTATVSAPQGVDVYGLAKNHGIVGEWDSAANRISVECRRADLARMTAAGLTVESSRMLRACPVE